MAPKHKLQSMVPDTMKTRKTQVINPRAEREESLEAAFKTLQIATEATELRIDNLVKMIELIEPTVTTSGERNVKKLFDAIDEVKEEIYSLKVAEVEIAKLQEENKNIIGKLYSEIEDMYNLLINGIQDQ